MMTVLWTGIGLGALYALVAALFNVGMAQTGVFNFAAPQTVMIGAFVAYELAAVRDVPYLVVMVVSPLVGALVGTAVELLAVRPLKGDGHSLLITTVGAAFLIEGYAYVRYDVQAYSVPFLVEDRTFTVFGGRVNLIDFIMMIAAVVVITGLHVLSQHTRWGLNGRAATIDPAAASVLGVNVRFNRTVAFAVAGGLGGLVGLLAGAKIHASADLGTALIVFAFVAFALGGIGSYWGCLAGGVVVGLSQALASRYVGGSWSMTIVFALLLAALLIRPTGLFGLARLRQV